MLLTLLSHLTSALEVPLDREQSLLDSKLKCGSERFIFSRNLTFSYCNGTFQTFLLRMTELLFETFKLCMV